ncbi:MAG: hypothetical protein ACRYFS_08640 [Janthinobacterium lividum]
MNTQPSVKVFKRGKLGRVLGQRKQTATQEQLVQTVTKLAAEVEALQQRLAQIERTDELKLYRVPQSLAELGPRRLPPAGQTAMQAIQGKLKVDEPIEELLEQLKAFG